MKKYLLALSVSLLAAGTLLAQRTPLLSPNATVNQTVGVTDFTIKYSRPGIKQRSVFADSSVLAPYGQVWRTGANQSTTFETSTEITFGDKKVPAGKYSLFSIPGGSAWTVILNKNIDGGIGGYKQSEDIARVTVAPVSSAYNETFTISFSDLTENSAMLNLSWSSVNIPVKISLATAELTLAGLDKAITEKPEDVATLQSTAGYLLSQGKDLPKALALADKAIGLKESFSNLWIKAQILAKLGKTAEALPIAQKALAVGATSPDPSFSFYKGQIEKGIETMKATAPVVKEAATAVKGKKKKS